MEGRGKCTIHHNLIALISRGSPQKRERIDLIYERGDDDRFSGIEVF